ncbi:ABC transporter permease subunit [Fredinandcohnia humi]
MKNNNLVIGGILFLLFVLLTFVGPELPFVKKGMEGQRVIMGEGEIRTAPFPPSEEFLLGTDHEGRDLLSVIIVGARDTLQLIVSITVIRYVVALILVLLSVKGKGPFHWLLQWWNQISSGLPIIFAAILFISLPFFTFSDHRMLWAILILALIEVGRVGYIIQERTIRLSRSQFVEAGVTVGVSPIRLFINYYIPNLLPQIITNFCIDLGRVTLLLGQLGVFYIFVTQEFVQTGYGTGELRNTSYNWATFLGESRGDMLTTFWIPLFPALAITIVIFIFTILGEGLRQYFDKKENAHL